MHDGLQPLDLVRLVEHGQAEFLAVDLAAGGGSGKGSLDGGDGSALVQLVHFRIRIAHADAERPQTGRHRRLAHADRARETDHQHQPPSMSRTSRARSSAVTCGRTPNHFSKPGTA